jgi:hypothetical protein
MRHAAALPTGIEVFDLLGTRLQHASPGDAADELRADAPDSTPATPTTRRFPEFAEGDPRFMTDADDALFSPATPSTPHVNSGAAPTFGFGGLGARRDADSAPLPPRPDPGRLELARMPLPTDGLLHAAKTVLPSPHPERCDTLELVAPPPRAGSKETSPRIGARPGSGRPPLPMRRAPSDDMLFEMD